MFANYQQQMGQMPNQMMMQQAAAMNYQQMPQGGNPAMMQQHPGMNNMQQNNFPNMLQLQNQLSGGNPMQKQGSKFENEKTLIISNLADNTFENDLYKFFQSSGHNIIKCKVMIDFQTSKPKGFGYLNFRSEEEAVNCLNAMNNSVISGKTIQLSRKRDKDTEFEREANLLVKNLPENLTSNELNELFAKHGHVLSCKIEIGPDNKSRMFGYVQF
jgi:RNA recognition motif-containing protein